MGLPLVTVWARRGSGLVTVLARRGNGLVTVWARRGSGLVTVWAIASRGSGFVKGCELIVIVVKLTNVLDQMISKSIKYIFPI